MQDKNQADEQEATRQELLMYEGRPTQHIDTKELGKRTDCCFPILFACYTYKEKSIIKTDFKCDDDKKWQNNSRLSLYNNLYQSKLIITLTVHRGKRSTSK